MEDQETKVEAADASATHTTREKLDSDTTTTPADTWRDEALEDEIFEKAGESAAANDTTGDHVYPVGPKLILIVVSLMLAVFCVALDNTVCSTGKKKGNSADMLHADHCCSDTSHHRSVS